VIKLHDNLLTDEEMQETEEYFNAIITLDNNATNQKKAEENKKPKKQCKGSECQKEFNNLLLETIEEVLTSLGAPVKNSIYGCLENNFEICKEQIPKKIVDFTDFLHKSLGTSAADRLEKKFIETLNKKISEKLSDFGYEPSSNTQCDLSFNDFIIDIRQTYLTNHQSDAISFEFK
jgi:hypothetical protein